MTGRPAPAWFELSERATPETMNRIAASVEGGHLPLQVRSLPSKAHWFLLDSLLVANNANREGMHANALSVTRQCLEAISIIELGLSRHPAAVALLAKWDGHEATPGELRKWLSENMWPLYGCGLWAEPWENFMAHLAKAVQPYAHYTAHLAQWQDRLIDKVDTDDPRSFYVQISPRAYDPQKATRITLFHAILTFALARIWIATTNKHDPEFSELINRLRVALGESKYLDGKETNWESQFWAMMWFRSGSTVPE